MNEDTNSVIDLPKALDESMKQKPRVIMKDDDKYIEIMDATGDGMYEDYSYAAVDTPLKLLRLIFYLSERQIFSADLIHELIWKCGDKFGYDVESFEADPV